MTLGHATGKIDDDASLWPMLATAASLSAGAGVLALYIGLIAAADPLLAVDSAPQKSDVLVVLGGDGPPRAARAAELFDMGMAPRILVTGSGDCLAIRQLMIAAGVPAAAVTVECASRNTWQNAMFSAPLLYSADITSGLLVTSWYHTRRALGSFEAAMPQVRWTATSPPRPSSVWAAAWDTDGPEVLKEYVKLAWYRLRHGIPLALPQDRGNVPGPGAGPKGIAAGRHGP